MFDGEETGEWTTSYPLSWTTVSYSPVLKYRLQYRKHQVSFPTDYKYNFLSFYYQPRSQVVITLLLVITVLL
jgi:hypothetical protein